VQTTRPDRVSSVNIRMIYIAVGHDTQNLLVAVDVSWTIRQLDVELRRGRYVHP